MRILILIVACVFVLASTVWAEEGKSPRVALETSKGTIVLELYPDKAPRTVANFLENANAGFYDGTVFHRVIPRFMIQGGGFTPDMKQKPVRATISNEADNGLTNLRGTIAMARRGDPHSATAQFFVNLVDNGALDHTGKNMQGWGYAVFGKVIEGMEVVDAIAGVATGDHGPFQNVPAQAVVINSVTLLDAAASEPGGEEAPAAGGAEG